MHVFSDTMKKADTTLKLLKIDPLNKNIHKPLDALDVGWVRTFIFIPEGKVKNTKEVLF